MKYLAALLLFVGCTASNPGNPTPTPTPVQSPTPSPTPIQTPSATPISTPSATPKPTPTPMMTPTATPTPTATKSAMPTPTPTKSPSPTPSPSATPIAIGPTVIPSNAIVVRNLDQSSSWVFNHDAGTPGASTGTSALVTSPSVGGKARQYSMSYTGSGGEIFHVSYAKDPNSLNFAYDVYVNLVNPATTANLELDMNQVIPNGNTVIYGVQCDGYSKTWDYTGTVPSTHWVHSNVSCDPKSWKANTWRHVQIVYSRDTAGNITYKGVALDGVYSAFTGATLLSSKALGWTAGDLLTNFQIDGLGATGSNTVYASQMTIYRW